MVGMKDGVVVLDLGVTPNVVAAAADVTLSISLQYWRGLAGFDGEHGIRIDGLELFPWSGVFGGLACIRILVLSRV